MKRKYKIETLSESGAVYHVEVNVAYDEVTICLDTSGEGLHKRGYRPIMGLAPMKETLAAAIIMLSVWNKDRPLIDCFAGSGTIPIEAALIAQNTAPGIKRHFAFEQFKGAPQVIDKVRDEALSVQNLDVKTRISGFDIDGDSIKMAMIHAENAGVKTLSISSKWTCATCPQTKIRRAYQQSAVWRKAVDRKGIEAAVSGFRKTFQVFGHVEFIRFHKLSRL